ncbi:CHAD domain-containing protein [Bradyrhizobium sp. LjRoot220]|uniref:CYTH and CHAD domain-containing protein n=1 Tax=Bradyrhizobium sp. LjRoot220 TaxID=3342284 RepID=UPI003ECEC84D
MGVETELKFRVPARGLRGLARGKIPGGMTKACEESKQVSTYFDTAKHKLRRYGLALRVRQIGDKHIQTIKSAAGAQFGRGEWETEIEGNAPDLKKVDGTPLEPLASKKLRGKLKPIFKTSVHRVTLPVRSRSSEIELAVDRGRLIAGRRSSPIEELELELKTGRPADLFRLAKFVGKKIGAELYFRTKSERGYELASGKNGQVVFAESIELQDDMTAEEGFRVIARSAVRHFAANADAVRMLDPEGIHQMRVGLRRLRAAISLFSDVLSEARTEKIKSELRWLTSELAPAREIDVFVKERISQAVRDIVPRRAGKAIETEFAARRAKALERASEAVGSARCRALLVDVLEWIEERHRGGRKDTTTPIGTFAAEILRRRVKKLLKQGRDLGKLSARERHRFRIRVKKVRYAVEFFESLFPGKREHKQIARLSRHLKNIQDALGSLNDFAAHRKMAAEVALKSPRKDRRVRAFASGIVLGREDEAVRPLMKAAVKEVRALQADAF